MHQPATQYHIICLLHLIPGTVHLSNVIQCTIIYLHITSLFLFCSVYQSNIIIFVILLLLIYRQSQLQ